MVTLMWWLMICRSAAVSVPARMVRFSISSAVRKSTSSPAGIAPAVFAGDGAHALLVGRGHGLAADVAEPEKLAVLLDFPEAAAQGLVHRLGVGTGDRAGAEGRDLGIAPEDLEAGVDERDAVEDGRELGRLVHDMDGRGDLAAIMEERGDLELVAAGVGQVPLRERTARRGVRGLGEHHREHGDAVAVPAGVG
jgi:hypothetical protein